MTLANLSPNPVFDIYETLATLAQPILIILKISSTPLTANFREIPPSFLTFTKFARLTFNFYKIRNICKLCPCLFKICPPSLLLSTSLKFLLASSSSEYQCKMIFRSCAKYGPARNASNGGKSAASAVNIPCQPRIKRTIRGRAAASRQGGS